MIRILDYSVIAKEITIMSGIFVEGRSQTLLYYSSKWGRLILKEGQKNLPSKLGDSYCPKQHDHM